MQQEKNELDQSKRTDLSGPTRISARIEEAFSLGKPIKEKNMKNAF